jgi:hypothetical protein
MFYILIGTYVYSWVDKCHNIGCPTRKFSQTPNLKGVKTYKTQISSTHTERKNNHPYLYIKFEVNGLSKFHNAHT